MMTTTVQDVDFTSQAIGRATGYTLLAHLFAFPDAPGIAAMQEAAAAAAPFSTGGPIVSLSGVILAAEPEPLVQAYTRLFSLSSSPDCPNFESAYFSPDPIQQTNRMADIGGFYRAFGVDALGTGLRPDDISVELEFMGYLCRKELHARMHLGAPRTAQVVKAQRMFVGEHLGLWAAEFGKRVALNAGACDFYRLLGVALDDWITEEAALMKVDLAGAADSPAPGWNVREEEPPGDEEAGDAIFALDELPVL